MDPLTEQIIGAAIDVHRELGPGLLESAYQVCLGHELGQRGLSFEAGRPLPVVYKGVRLDAAYVLDIVVEGEVVLELKAVASLLPIHEAQIPNSLSCQTRSEHRRCSPRHRSQPPRWRSRPCRRSRPRRRPPPRQAPARASARC